MPKNHLALRKKYPRFVFEKYFWKISEKDLKISFHFKIGHRIKFNPKVVIKNIAKNRVKEIGKGILDNLIFNLGLIEILSYWKATCSPEIKILAGSLNKEQVRWWRDLIIRGMGQFFYENEIDFTEEDFLKITSSSISTASRPAEIEIYEEELKNRVLVPIGGGKDSIVTLEILKKANKNITCFVLNPTKAARQTIKTVSINSSKVAGYKKSIVVRREIDRKLLELNQKGFLNGHTPFSAYLAFLSVLCAVLFGHKFIAFSNERSSNEGNLKYLGKTINHQYSKSFDFEKKFRKYLKKYLAKDTEYFSFLRPLYEIQVAKLFSKYPRYFSSFISCNEAFKTYSGKRKPRNTWCKQCPKCLFVFTILYPFLEEHRMIKIFKENLFKKIGLVPIMLHLMGERDFKPFECVGTEKESLVAFYLNLKKAIQKKYKKRFSDKLPFLLKYFENKILPKHPNLKEESKKMMNSWNKEHYLSKELEKILERAVQT